MKHLVKSFYALGLLAVVFLSSCGDDEQASQDGTLQLSFLSTDITNGRSESTEEPSSIWVTIEDENQNEVYSREEFSLTAFGEGYLVNPVLLEVGNYQITEFLVLNTEEDVIFATPIEGSPLAGLVESPLPISFEITADEVEEIALEVISTEGVDPENLGYASLSFNVVPTVDILVSVFTTSASGTGYDLTAATLEVYADSELSFTQDLGDSINIVKLNTEVAEYEFIATLESGKSVSATVLNNDIGQYRTKPLELIFNAASADSETLYAILDNQLVTIDDVTAEITVVNAISLVPDNVTLNDLTYDVANSVFYAIATEDEDPALVKIDLDGNYTEIGQITLNGSQIPLVEGIAVDIDNNEVYIIASTDAGPNSNDFYSESLLTVDVSNAEATFVTEIITDASTPDDMDEITIKAGTLYGVDTQPPGADFLKLFSVDLTDLNQGGSTSVTTIFSGDYIAGATIAVNGDQLIFGAQRSLYELSISSPVSLDLIGETHTDAEYNGNVIRGIVYVD